jgi:hypothetical protein
VFRHICASETSEKGALIRSAETKLKISFNLSITFIINTPEEFFYICNAAISSGVPAVFQKIISVNIKT